MAKPKEEQLKADSNTPVNVSNSCSPKRNRATWITLSIALIALVLVLYTMKQNVQLQRQIDDGKKQIQEISVEQMTKQQLEKTLRPVIEEQTNLKEGLSNLRTQFTNVKIGKSENWQLLKARYYLELAQINAHWSNNEQTTIALLEAANQLLSQQHTTDIVNIRQIIAKEIVQLQVFKTVDLLDVLSQIDALQSLVIHLNIQALPVSDQTKQKVELNPTQSKWRIHLQNSLNTLSQLVIVHRHNEDTSPILSPLLVTILKESIQLNLQEAQWGLLNNNPLQYSSALKQAGTTLKKLLHHQEKKLTPVLKKLEQLQTISLSTEKPNIGKAIPLLTQLINSQSPEKENNTSTSTREEN